MEYAVIAALFIFTGIREYLNFKERKDMLDRLMSRNFTEYKDNEKPEKNQLEPEDDGLTDLEEAKNEMIYGQEED